MGAWHRGNDGFARLRVDVLLTPETSKALRRVYLYGAIDALAEIIGENFGRGISPTPEMVARVDKLRAERDAIGV